jgi:hypothetical protein
MHFFESLDQLYVPVVESIGPNFRVGNGTTWSNGPLDPFFVKRYNGLASYDHVANELYYGGGTVSPGETTLRKITAAGVISQLTTSGATIGLTQTYMVADPSTGKPILFNRIDQTVKLWTGSSWTTVGTMPSGSYNSNARMFAVALRGFSGSVFMIVNGNSHEAYLYRRV